MGRRFSRRVKRINNSTEHTKPRQRRWRRILSRRVRKGFFLAESAESAEMNNKMFLAEFAKYAKDSFSQSPQR